MLRQLDGHVQLGVDRAGEAEGAHQDGEEGRLRRPVLGEDDVAEPEADDAEAAHDEEVLEVEREADEVGVHEELRSHEALHHEKAQKAGVDLGERRDHGC